MSDATLIPSKYRDVTPSDTVPVNAGLGLYIGTAGTVRIAGVDGVSANFQAQAGQYISGKVAYVMSTGTTASGIVALS